MSEFLNRVAKPVMIPVTAAAFVFVLVFAFSRVLLAVPEVGSTSLAMMLAAEILGVASVLAAARKVNAAQKAISIVLGLSLIAGGGVAAAIGEREFGHGEDEHGPTIVAEGLAFLEEEVAAPAGEPFQLTFDNRDAGVPHNVAIYTDESAAESLFVGEIFNGVASQIYDVPALPEGTSFFRCDVHPDMTGAIVAGEGGGPGPGPNAAEITALQIAFDVTEFTLPADTETTIIFHNQDGGIPHNVAIYADDTAAEELFVGETFNGVRTEEYVVPPIEAGEYYFQCDVHANMNGTAIFE